MGLTAYNKKRNFGKTPEPAGKSRGKNHYRFVVQRHDASRLHYDFRLELGGVLKSWAVPKGPSMNPADKRLAVMVEDHPVSYIHFEGVIPEGNYGAGTVEVWDRGLYLPVDEELNKISEKKALDALENGELKFLLKGEKLEGGFVLVRMKTAGEKNWLLIKHKDDWSVNKKYDSENYSSAALSKRSRKAPSGKKTGKRKKHAGR